MAEARQRAAWGRTAAVLALLANCHRDPQRGRPLRPADFDPYAGRCAEPARRATVGIAALQAVFIERRVPAEMGGAM